LPFILLCTLIQLTATAQESVTGIYRSEDVIFEDPFKDISNFSNVHGIKILQDSKGFMWFAHYGVLYKYDGYSVKEYDAFLSPGIKSVKSALPVAANPDISNWVLCQ